MKIIARPSTHPQHQIDLTQRLLSVIAEELWRLRGGDERSNWLEAERHLRRLVGAAKSYTRDTEIVVAEGDAQAIGESLAEEGAIPRACPGCPRLRRNVAALPKATPMCIGATAIAC